jgi:hypothetical protein
MLRGPLFLMLCGSLLAGCAAQSEPLQLPKGARPDLEQRWLTGNGDYVWPPNEGFASPPVLVILPPGLMLDRIGPTYGHFLSPRGASYKARALPYGCAAEADQYHVYQVAKPLPVWAGKAAAWFDEPGGATQFEADATVQMLLDDQSLIEPRPKPAAIPCSG